MPRKIYRGEIYYADLDPVVGSEQGGVRPVLVIQNDVGNSHSPTTIVAAMSGKTDVKADIPTHYVIGTEFGLRQRTIILLEQVRTLDKKRLQVYVGKLSAEAMGQVDECILVSLGLNRV